MLRRLTLCCCALLLLTCLPTVAQASLLITPKRLVLDSDTQQGVFRLVNTSGQTQTYELGWQQLRMDEQGSLVDQGAEAPGGLASLIRLAPGRVSLQPGERQTVRLAPRLPAGLPEGEYMSHLLFRPVGTASGQVSEPNGAERGVSMVLNARIGFAVPVFLRHGRLAATAGLRPLKIDGERLHVELQRTGSASLFGRLIAFWGQPGQAGIQVGQVDGVAVYANLTRREATIPLTPPAGVTLGPGLLLVRYIDPGNDRVLAEATVRLE